ncbi:MAG: cytochrome c-type biogenesis protein CcmH [Thermoflexales bacterium]|nr:cytochrome c-type biogenesis protein CcmH [Thermoflexales bacterium]
MLQVFLVAVLVGIVMLLAPSRAAQAQGLGPGDETYRIAKQLNCPTCAGRNLADCPTETCAQWKAEITYQLQQGRTAEEIIRYFEERFGPTVRQEPPRTGSTLLLWIAPVGAAAVFLVVAVLTIQRASSRRASPAVETDTGEDPLVAELEAEVRRRW